jgi:hypothetical protein
VIKNNCFMEFDVAWLSVCRSLSKAELCKLMLVSSGINSLVHWRVVTPNQQACHNELWANYCRTEFPSLFTGKGQKVETWYQAYCREVSKTTYVHFRCKHLNFPIVHSSSLYLAYYPSNHCQEAWLEDGGEGSSMLYRGCSARLMVLLSLTKLIRLWCVC